MKKFPRSPYDEIGGLVYFRRMADKVRLHLAGELPDEYVHYLGGAEPTAFDGRCCRFLRIDYDAFVEEVKRGLSDDQLLVWAMKVGRDPLPPAKEAWCTFLRKRGWRDEATAGLRADLATARENVTFHPAWGGEADGSSGVKQPALEIATFFDLMDAEEGRPPRIGYVEAMLPVGTAQPVPLPSRPLLFSNVRSCYDTLGGIAHFGRMLDKIRLHHVGKLLPEWIRAKGGAYNYDGLLCQFLGIPYVRLEEIALAGRSDEEILQWALTTGVRPTAEEIKIWNTFLAKRNWRDQHTHRLYFRLDELGLPYNAVPTMFDYIDLDEGRPVRPLETIIPY